MKKLIAIVISFIFIFDATAYPAKSTQYRKNSLRVPVDPEYKRESEAIANVRPERITILLEKLFKKGSYASRQREFYNQKERETTEIIKKGNWPSRLPEDRYRGGIDLVIGFSNIRGDESDIPLDVMTTLEGLAEQLKEIFERAYQTVEFDKGHISISRIARKDLMREDHTIDTEYINTLTENLQKVVNIVNEIGPFEVVLKGLLLMPDDGTIIVKGYVTSDKLERLRSRLGEEITEVNEIDRNKLICHFTLGRLRKDHGASQEDLKRVNGWVNDHREEFIGSFMVSRPVLVATTTMYSLLIDAGAQEKLEVFNQQLRAPSDSQTVRPQQEVYNAVNAIKEARHSI